VYQREIVLYTRSRSLRCWRAKRFLSRQGYRYEVVDATDNPELVADLSETVHHRVALPCVFVDHRPVGGFGESPDLAGSGALAHLLRDDLCRT
jgi:glutaredoxin